MTTLEAIAILSNLKAGLKPKEAVAVLKGIQALTEKAQREQREQREQALKEQHKHKCRDCDNFSFAYGGLSTTLGHCAILDEPFTDNRKASNRACKDFISIKEANDNED